MKGRCTEGTGPNGEYTIDVSATNDVSYHYTFLEEEDRGGCFDAGNPYLADYFRSYGRCVVVIDQRVHDIYGDKVGQGLGLPTGNIGHNDTISM